MDKSMREFKMQSFVKYVVLKIDLFESEIIDEANFGIDEKFNIMQFKRKYNRRDDCVIVEEGLLVI